MQYSGGCPAVKTTKKNVGTLSCCRQQRKQTQPTPARKNRKYVSCLKKLCFHLTNKDGRQWEMNFKGQLIVDICFPVSFAFNTGKSEWMIPSFLWFLLNYLNNWSCGESNWSMYLMSMLNIMSRWSNQVKKHVQTLNHGCLRVTGWTNCDILPFITAVECSIHLNGPPQHVVWSLITLASSVAKRRQLIWSLLHLRKTYS